MSNSIRTVNLSGVATLADAARKLSIPLARLDADPPAGGGVQPINLANGEYIVRMRDETKSPYENAFVQNRTDGFARRK